MSKMINWECKTEREANLIFDIATRYLGLVIDAGCAHNDTHTQAEMSVRACHLNGRPLKLARLLHEADDFNLLHDVGGIHRHINKKDARLENCFLPRYAK